MRSRVRPARKLAQLSEQANRSRIHRAYLAEDYDGIGQYILVAFSRSSTSAAVRARIAAGDFGTGQSMPVGTPVSVFVHRGLVEILSMGVK